MKPKWRQKLKSLLKPQTWGQSVVLVLLAWLAVQIGQLTVKYTESLLEARLKLARISVVYQQVSFIKDADLESFAREEALDSFDRNLDDCLSSNYCILPFKFQNTTRNPVEKVSVDLDLGSPYARIIDIKPAIRTPKNKNVVIRHSLPHMKWQRATNDLYVIPSWEHHLGELVDIYCSVANDRGFGKVNSAPVNPKAATLRFAPTAQPSYWFLYASSILMVLHQTNQVSEATDTVYSAESVGYVQDGVATLALPNPVLWDPSFREDEAASINVHSEVTADLLRFSRGQATIWFDSGFDPNTEVDIYVLAKVPPGSRLLPKAMMTGPVGVGFEQANSPPRCYTPLAQPLDDHKILLMPRQVNATATQKGVFIYWDIPTTPNYSHVRIFRSRERALGDWSDMGEQIYEGFGNTNSFEIVKREQSLRLPDPESTGRYFSRPPAPFTTNSAAAFSTAPPRPSNLRIIGSEHPENVAYFIDTPPETNSVFTYTLYAFDKTGVAS